MSATRRSNPRHQIPAAGANLPPRTEPPFTVPPFTVPLFTALLFTALVAVAAAIITPVAHAQATDGTPAPPPAPAPVPAPAPATPRALDAAIRRDVVDTLAAQLQRFYVDADTGRLIAQHLHERLGAGAYDRFTAPADFAQALTTDLRAVNGDLHLGVQPEACFPVEHPGPHGLVTPRPNPPGSPPPPDEPQPSAEMVAEWRSSNFGLERAARLEGNVGYLEVRGFFDLPDAYAATEAALGFLERTDAIIFDLRQMPGGSGEMSNWLISHFTGTDTVPNLLIANRSAGDSIVRWTLAKVAGKKRPDIPLYVLTSRGTASAGEDFTFVLKNLGRATVVGERTAGAGHNVAFLDAGHGFVSAVSYTRVMDPRSHREWERVGVQPDVQVSPERALDVAHALALRAIAARADGRQKHMLELTAEALDARAHPHAVAAKLLARYAGTYGERVLSLHDGILTFQRIPYPARALVPLNDSTFALDTVERVTVEGARAGTPTLRLVRSSGDTVRAARTRPALPARRVSPTR